MVKIDQDVTGRIWVFFANVSKKKKPSVLRPLLGREMSLH
jgi:hypothetical protein